MNLAQIYEAADKITAHYRDKGYMVAKTYVPAQDASKGTLRFKLLIGRYGAIEMHNGSLVRDSYLRGVIDHTIGTGSRCSQEEPAPLSQRLFGLPDCAGGSPYIHQAELERAMLLISDLKGAGVPNVAMGAGNQQGVSDFVFTMPEARRVTGFIMGDNFGPPWTGRGQVSGGVNVNSIFGIGDQLSFFGILSGTTDLTNASATYSVPIGYDGLHGSVTGFHTTYALGGTFARLDADGIADGVTGVVAYPLIRSRVESLYLSAALTHKELNDRAFSVSYADRAIDLGTLSFSNDAVGVLPVFDLPLSTSVGGSVTIGNVHFGDPTQRSENELGADTVGTYARFNLTFTSTVAFTEKLSGSIDLRAQKATRSLDTSEQLQLTGSFGIRSFDEGLSGDDGYIVTPELRYALPTPKGQLFGSLQHSIGVFTDVGGVWLENGAFTVLQKSFTQLNDVGISYAATFEYSPGRLIFVKALGAFTYGSNDGAALYDTGKRGLVQAGFTF